MEAKDTVMGGEEIVRLTIAKGLDASTYQADDYAKRVSNAQAEISFKAGYEQALKDYNIKPGLP